MTQASNKDPRWAGATVVCIASGPSLTAEDVAIVQVQHAAGKCKVVVINREFEFAPWADVLYIADFQCWQEYNSDIVAKFTGEKWTCNPQVARTFKVNLIGRAYGAGYSPERGTITTGGNSGFQAVHLAAYWGAQRILLLGYDMQRTGGKEHHYGKHRGRLANGVGFKEWLARFKPLVIDLKRQKIQLLNLSRSTALPAEWIPQATVEQVTWQ